MPLLKWYVDLNTGPKLYVVTIMVGIFVAGIGLAGYWGLVQVGQVADGMYKAAYQNLDGGSGASMTALLAEIDVLKAKKDAVSRWLTALLLVGVISGTAGGITLGYFISRLISRPIQLLDGLAEKVAEGDLSLNVLASNDSLRRNDEVGHLARSFDKMVSSVRRVIVEAGRSSEEVNQQSVTLSASANQLASSTQEMAAILNGVAEQTQTQEDDSRSAIEALKQFTEVIDQIAIGAQDQSESATQTSELLATVAQRIEDIATTANLLGSAAGSTLSKAEVGWKTVEKTISAMDGIRDTVLTAVDKVKSLSERTDKIDSILQVITEIAEQTDLLALNAAIEAARAGEHGKSFAVVADEVRNLAERSGRAAAEIGVLLRQIQDDAQETVNATFTGADRAEQGTKMANEAGRALSEIIGTVRETVAKIKDVSSATQHIAAGSSNVVRAMENMAAVTQQNTASTQQMSANSARMAKVIDQMGAASTDTTAAAQQVVAAVSQVRTTSEGVAASARVLLDTATKLSGLIGAFQTTGQARG